MPRAAAIRNFVVLAILLATATSGFAQISPLRNFPDQETLDRYNLVIHWYAQVPASALREKILDLKVIEDQVFATSNQGLIHCLDAETGSIRWTQSIGDNRRDVFPPAVTSELAFVTSGTELVALDRFSGAELWKRDLPSMASSGPAANEDFVYVQTADNKISAFALKLAEESSKLEWPLKRKFDKRPMVWFYSAGGPMVDPPIVLPELVAFATTEGILYASALKEKKILYRFFTYSRQAAPLAHLGTDLFIATEEFDIYAVDLQNGFLRWRFVAGYPVYEKPTPFMDDLFALAEGAGLLCITNHDEPDKGLKAGQLRWRSPSSTRIIGCSKENVYAADLYDNFQILARKDGRPIASLPARSFPISSDNQFTDRLYMSTEDGLILCLHEKQNVKPYRHPQTYEEPEKVKEKPTDTEERRPSFFDEAP
jgi:hypothetical protein